MLKVEGSDWGPFSTDDPTWSTEKHRFRSVSRMHMYLFVLHTKWSCEHTVEPGRHPSISVKVP